MYHCVKIRNEKEKRAPWAKGAIIKKAMSVGIPTITFLFIDSSTFTTSNPELKSRLAIAAKLSPSSV